MAWNIRPEGIPKIALCLPHTGEVTLEWVQRTWGPLCFQTTNWCDKKPVLLRGPPIDLARENITSQALDLGADYLFFIDSDIIMESPTDPNIGLLRLFRHNLPIVSGLYRAKKSGKNYNPWAMWRFKDKDSGFEPIMKWNSKLVEVDVVGLGCTLIKREVFENVPRPWFRWDLNIAPSEDFYFLLKAKTRGKYKVIVDTTVRCSHIDTMKILPTDDPGYDSLYV